MLSESPRTRFTGSPVSVEVGMCLRQFDYRHTVSILSVLHNREYTSIILEMPDGTKASLFLCPLPLSGRPRRTLFMVAPTRHDKRKETSHFDITYSIRDPASLV